MRAGAGVGRRCTAWRGAATPAAAGCRGFAARGQEGSRGGLLRALRGFRVRFRLRDLRGLRVGIWLCVLCVSFLLRGLRVLDPLRLALLASSPSGGAKSYGLCVLCVGFKRGRRWSGLDDARRKAEAFPEGVDDLVLFVETDDER